MKRPREMPTKEADERAGEVLGRAFGGLHHVDGWDRRQRCGSGLIVTTFQDLATYDYNVLTRLVVAAHDGAVRLAIAPASPNCLRLVLHLRTREGDITARHPTIEDHVEAIRKRYWDR